MQFWHDGCNIVRKLEIVRSLSLIKGAKHVLQNYLSSISFSNFGIEWMQREKLWKFIHGKSLFQESRI